MRKIGLASPGDAASLASARHRQGCLPFRNLIVLDVETIFYIKVIGS
jgi:hypothetical protein